VNRKDVLKEFINEINYNGLMTSFIKNFFDYKYLNDYNYIFRMIDNEMELIIDISRWKTAIALMESITHLLDIAWYM